MNRSFPRYPKGYGHWRLDIIKVADPQWKVAVNRIHGHPIGVYAILGSHSVGICKPISSEERLRRTKRTL